MSTRVTHISRALFLTVPLLLPFEIPKRVSMISLDRLSMSFGRFFELCELFDYLRFQILQVGRWILVVRRLSSSQWANNRLGLRTEYHWNTLSSQNRQLASRLTFSVHKLVHVERHCWHSSNRVPLATYPSYFCFSSLLVL